MYYTVQNGDTLSGIAAKFGMSLGEITSLNNISDPNKIQIGQVLKVYGNTAFSSTSSNENQKHNNSSSNTTSSNISFKGTYISGNQLQAIGWTNITQNMIDDLNNCLKIFNITTKLRMCHFISQCSEESCAGLYKEEIASGAEYNYRSDLGNIYPGDGQKYKGAGYIQLTGRANYTKFAEYMNDNKIIELGASYVANKYPWTSAGFWWHLNNINALCDTNPSVRQVTLQVNGGVQTD